MSGVVVIPADRLVELRKAREDRGLLVRMIGPPWTMLPPPRPTGPAA